MGAKREKWTFWPLYCQNVAFLVPYGANLAKIYVILSLFTLFKRQRKSADPKEGHLCLLGERFPFSFLF